MRAPACVVLCLCVCLAALAPTTGARAKDPAQQSATGQGLGQISGRVIRADTGVPLAKVEVSLHPQDQDTFKAAAGTRVGRTGPDGAFTFSDVPPGSYALEAWRSGFTNDGCDANMNCGWQSLTLARGQSLEHVELRLTPAGVIAGTVYDEDQEPVAGIGVYALRVNFLPGGRREIYAVSSATTDDRGNFRMPDLRPGSYYVRTGEPIQLSRFALALKEGPDGGAQFRDTYFPGTALLDEAQRIEIASGAETNAVRFSVATEKTFSITGRILGAEKSGPLKPSEIRVTKRSDAEQMWRDAGNALLAPDGSFAIPRLPPGDYTLAAVAFAVQGDLAQEVDAGFASVRISESNVRADIELGRAAEIRGKVAAPPGFSFAGMQIILESRGSSYYPADLDSSGRFNLRNAPPGKYTLSILDRKHEAQLAYLKEASCSGRDFGMQPLMLDMDTVLDCRITAADDTGAVSGQVTEGDLPAAGLVVVLIPESRALRRLPRYTLTARTDAAGRYKIVGTIPGDYLLFTVPPSENHDYFALDFADRFQRQAERIRVEARGMQMVDAKPKKAE